MTIQSKIILVACCLFPLTLHADTFYSGTNISYVGNGSARDVCKAVVQDDQSRLKTLIEYAS